MTRTMRTALDAARGRDARGAFDHSEVLARLADSGLGLACVEDLCAASRDALLCRLSEADVAELEVYLARRGFTPKWRRAT